MNNQNNGKRIKVFVPNKGSGHDYTDAHKYGDLVFVTVGRLNPFNVGLQFRKWEESLAQSNPEDLIIVTSLPVLCMIGAAIFGEMHKRINLLVFHSDGSYRRRDIVL